MLISCFVLSYLPSDAQNVVEVVALGKQLQRFEEQLNFPITCLLVEIFFQRTILYCFFSDTCMVHLYIGKIN